MGKRTIMHNSKRKKKQEDTSIINGYLVNNKFLQYSMQGRIWKSSDLTDQLSRQTWQKYWRSEK